MIKELGYEVNFLDNNTSQDFKNKSIEINGKNFKIPKMLMSNNFEARYKSDIKDALSFNRNLLIENFISPNRLKFPFSRRILEQYYN